MAKSKRITVAQIVATFPGKHLVVTDYECQDNGVACVLISARVVSAHETLAEAVYGVPEELRKTGNYTFFDPEPVTVTGRELAMREWLQQKYQMNVVLQRARRAG